jgi:hypothetical protein
VAGRVALFLARPHESADLSGHAPASDETAAPLLRESQRH